MTRHGLNYAINNSRNLSGAGMTGMRSVMYKNEVKREEIKVIHRLEVYWKGGKDLGR